VPKGEWDYDAAAAVCLYIFSEDFTADVAIYIFRELGDNKGQHVLKLLLLLEGV